MPFDGACPTKRWPPCTHATVAEIVDCRDPALRNLAITQSYHQLTRAFGRRVGARDVPWTGFAVWASKTAGLFIRRDWLPVEIHALVTRRTGAVARQVGLVEQRLRDHVAHGNRLVYAEVGPLFVDLLECLDTPPARRSGRVEAMLARLRPGPVQTGGQGPLIDAARAYLDAAECSDDVRRAQLVLLGNLLIACHEQWRLQPEIHGALDSAWGLLPKPRLDCQRSLRRRLAGQLRRGLTRLMRVHTPRVSLRLARDVPVLASGRMFPAPLERICLPKLARLIDEFDRTPNTTAGSGAEDWGDFDDRMNYLVELFRSRQRDRGLWVPPFSFWQVSAMQRGELPSGAL